MFGFRKCVYKLRLAVTGATGHAIGVGNGWNCESAEKHQGCGNHQ